MSDAHKRFSDGSAGDADYSVIGGTYRLYRQPDPRIADLILTHLGDAPRILNVGAGAGSYEPTDREVVALEPSASMRAQRPAHLSVAIDGIAESIPFPDNHFDASMATFTIHQWQDLARGLSEMRRVTRGPVVLLTCDPSEVQTFWLNDYAPDVLATEATRYPPSEAIRAGLGGQVANIRVPIPLDCEDGFNEAYYGRPEMLLDPRARLACSSWSFVEKEIVQASVKRLAEDLESGAWDARFGHFLTQPTYEGSLCLIIGV